MLFLVSLQPKEKVNISTRKQGTTTQNQLKNLLSSDQQLAPPVVIEPNPDLCK